MLAQRKRVRNLNHNIYLPYFKGTRLDTGLSFKFNFVTGQMRTRNEALKEIVREKKVLHVGFLDHAEVRDDKIATSDWLHLLISPPTTKVLYGLDIDEESIKSYHEFFPNLYSWKNLPLEEKFDLVLIPDVIEHVSDVSIFLNQLKKINTNLFIFTTPNAFLLANRFINKKENINSDHKCWYSPYTITNILYRNQFRVLSLEMCDSKIFTRPLKLLINKFVKSSRETMLITAKLDLKIKI